MTNWVLCVEVNGEWEACGFSTRKEALATFAALAQDYSEALRAAVLTEKTALTNHPPDACAGETIH